jgi:hypothetical protein
LCADTIADALNDEARIVTLGREAPLRPGQDRSPRLPDC